MDESSLVIWSFGTYMDEERPNGLEPGDSLHEWLVIDSPRWGGGYDPDGEADAYSSSAGDFLWVETERLPGGHVAAYRSPTGVWASLELRISQVPPPIITDPPLVISDGTFAVAQKARSTLTVNRVEVVLREVPEPPDATVSLYRITCTPSNG